MKTIVTRLPFALLSLATSLVTASAQTNVAPSVVIVSANMRPGTTLMDVIYRVNDPDDATVKVRALAFKDGVRSFANVIRPVTFVEGTGDKIGDAIPANANHALAWDVGADWNIDLGNVKFEILAMDGRGLLSFDWITIPAGGGYPQVTVSKSSPSDTEVLNALFWLYGSGDPGLSLTNGMLFGSSNSGVFQFVNLTMNASIANYATPFVLKRMNFAVAEPTEVAAPAAARAGVASGWLAANRPYSGVNVIVGWGTNAFGQSTQPKGLTGITAISAGSIHNLALRGNGTVVGWGDNSGGKTAPPTDLSGVSSIAAGVTHSLALKSNGTVVGWGNGYGGPATPPNGLTGVTAIAAGYDISVALKSDGTVVVWGTNYNYGHPTPPTSLTGVTAIAARYWHCLALKSDGTVVGWGHNSGGQATPPGGLTDVTAIAAGTFHSLALKSNGTVVGWGVANNSTPPAGLTGVTAIAAGFDHSLALKSDGTVVAWGKDFFGQATPPPGLTGLTAIAAGESYSLAVTLDAP